MKKLIVIGNQDFSRLLYTYLKEYDERHISAFAVNRQYMGNKSEFQNLPLIPLEELPNIYPPREYDAILGTGYSKMNDVRKSLFYQCKDLGYEIATFIHPTAIIDKNVTIGEGNVILENVVIQPFTRIGNGNLMWNTVTVSHDSLLGDFNTLAASSILAGFSELGNNCYLGNCSVVFNRAKVADYTLVGACAYIKRDTNPYDIIVPARCVTLEGKRSVDFL